jgi:hypothetical protein
MTASRTEGPTGPFGRSRQRFEAVVDFLEGDEATALQHADLEDVLQSDARELFCLLFQDHLDLRALTEERLVVADSDGVSHGAVEAGHERVLATIFGEVTVSRLAYRRRTHGNLHPADAALNLPEERHSHGLRRLAAIESSRGSFGDTVDAISRVTGAEVGKRQAEELTRAAAADFEAFYANRSQTEGKKGDVLVVSCDGKGIVMRPGELRPATAKAAARANNKLETRLSRGEKANRKRIAEVGAVYDVEPVARTATDILASGSDDAKPKPAPRATDKWVTASVVDDAAEVIARVFDEGDRRDPEHKRSWVALVDGNQHQIDRIHAEAKARGLTIPVVIDFIHVLEYVWKAVWSFFNEGDPAAEAWVHDTALAILQGGARQVAASIRRKATTRRMCSTERKGADTCATYLTNKAAYLDYPTALAAGWPIATGVIEGTCRFLVKDRMDITGARWSVNGAEAVLKLRALRSNGDFDAYYSFHLAQERRRVHESRYADGVIPRAA